MKNLLRKLNVLLLCTICSIPLHAQTLEEVNMSLFNYLFSTYLTDINNQGMVSGYYVNALGNNNAFVITAHGKEIIITIPGFTDTKAQAINNNGVALISASNGAGNITPYRVYIDTVEDVITSTVAVTTMQQTSGVPYKMNDNNDIVGWYQGASERWLWIDRDSLGGWDAKRYYTGNFPSYTYYNTYGQGVNNSRLVGGYYINGSTYVPFLYDGVAQSFNILTNAPSKTKIWAVNNNGVVAGEYQQANGTFMGFWGTVSGNQLTLNSLNTIFQSNTIQSVVNGINDNGEMVGAYLHPVTGKWVGFIYRPNNTEYRIPGFNFTHDTWSLMNDQNPANGVFTPNYYGNYNYNTMDPYANNGTPLLDQNIRTQFGLHAQVPNGISPDWVSYAQEVDRYHTVLLPVAYAIAKPLFMSKYIPLQAHGFNGYCYGFSYTSLLHHLDDALFSDWFDIPVNTDLDQLTNSDSNAIRAISRMYIKQTDIETIQKYNTTLYEDVEMWEGLYNLKTTFMKPMDKCNPRSVAVNYDNDYKHNLMPYKIHTPQMLPFEYPQGTIQYDTLFVYDSNFPQDSTRYFTVNSTRYSYSHDSVHYKDQTYDPIHYISFNKASLDETKNVSHAYLKATNANTYYANLTFSIGADAYYNIKDPANDVTQYNGSGYSNSSLVLSSVEEDANNALVPRTFIMDTSLSISFNSSNYADSVMRWNQVNNLRSMGITRLSLPSENDNGTLMSRFISYGNPDNVTKHFAGYLSQLASDMSQGTNILASNITAQPGDSFLTENPSEYVYKITRIAGVGNDTYDLTVDVINNGVLNEFSTTGISLSGNSAHTIDPYYNGPNGPQVVVYIDNGLNGNFDDTLFVPQVSLSINNPVHTGNNIKVYPNPATKYVNITFGQDHAGAYNVILSDINGRVLYNKTTAENASEMQLPLNSYSSGVYMLTVTDSKGQILYRDKLIKN